MPKETTPAYDLSFILPIKLQCSPRITIVFGTLFEPWLKKTCSCSIQTTKAQISLHSAFVISYSESKSSQNFSILTKVTVGEQTGLSLYGYEPPKVDILVSSRTLSKSA